MTQEMTITKALSELKLLDKRINRKIEDAVFISFKKGELGKLPNGLDEKEFGKNVEADYNSIADLIKRRNKIKASIVKSNAETVVNISGKDYTVAEAIERKNSIEYEIALLKKLKHDYSEVFRYVHEENEEIGRASSRERVDE